MFVVVVGGTFFAVTGSLFCEAWCKTWRVDCVGGAVGVCRRWSGEVLGVGVCCETDMRLRGKGTGPLGRLVNCVGV